MNGKIILNLAMSIDGYIADEKGNYEWIVGDGSKELDTNQKLDFNKFLEKIDVVVMGKTCFDQDMHKDFSNKDVYIATTKDMEDFENCKFINGDVAKQITSLKEDGKNIYLFGGGLLIKEFISNDIIDEYIIGIIPVILGKGKKLFYNNDEMIRLNLKNYYIEEGIVIMEYTK